MVNQIQSIRRMVGAEFEYRTVGKTSVSVEGYASVFDKPYSMGWYDETVEQGAFTRTLQAKPDVSFLVNHDGLPLARTTSNTLQLSQDSTGLHMRSELDLSDPDVQRIVPKMQRGDLDRMSFAFGVVPGGEEWSEDDTKRSLRELSLSGGDVSIVTHPASPTTSIALTRMRALIAEDPARVRQLWKTLKAGESDLTPEQEKRMATFVEGVIVEDQGEIPVVDFSDLLAEQREAVLEEVATVVVEPPIGLDSRDLRRLIQLSRRA